MKILRRLTINPKHAGACSRFTAKHHRISGKRFGDRRKNACPQALVLLTKFEFFDDGAITVDIGLHQVVEQVAAMADHLQQTTAGVVVLLVDLAVFGQLNDSLGENGDLNFGRACVLFGTGVGGDDGAFCLFVEHGFSTFFKISSIKERVGEARIKPAFGPDP